MSVPPLLFDAKPVRMLSFALSCSLTANEEPTLTKHLLTSAAILVASASLFTATGCAAKPKPEPTGLANPLPVQSFKRDWSSNLELAKGDGIDRVFLREDLVIAYSKSKAAYV